MANELTVSASLSFEKNGISAEFKELARSFDVAGDQYIRNIQSVSIAEVTLDKGGITTIGWIAIKNLDATNYLELTGATSGDVLAKLPAGGFAVFPVASANIFAAANTAACLVDYLMIEL